MDDEPLLSYVGKASVKMLVILDPTKWSKLGGSTLPIWERESDSSFFYSLWYDAELEGSSILQRLVKMACLVKIVRSVC